MAELGEALSERELAVLECLVSGATNREIARDLDISPNTVKVHLRNIFTKLDVSSRTEATTVAISKGLLTVPMVDDSAGQPEEELPVPASTPQKQIEGQLPNLEPDAATAGASRWRLTTFSILLVVIALLLGIAAGTRFLTSNGADATESSTAEAPPFEERQIGNTDWSAGVPMPRKRSNMALAAVGLDLYQIGGDVSAGVVNLVDVYETNTGQWRAAAPKPTAVADATAAVLFGEIYVPGGRLADGMPTSVVEAYSPANDAWRPITPLPEPVAGGLALSDGSFLYLFGGWDGQSYLDEGLVYDPNIDSWRPLPPMVHARANATGGVLDDKLYAVGGADEEGALAACEYYDPAGQAWLNCPDMLLPRAEAGAAVLGNRLLYVLGGATGGELPGGEVLDAYGNSWQPVEMPVLDGASSWHGLGVTNVESRIYAQGGRQDSIILADNYVFAPFIHRTYLPTVGDDYIER